MALQNKNNRTTNNHLELSIQISLSGLSFCVLNRSKNKITHLQDILFDKKQTPLKLNSLLNQELEENNILKTTYSKVCVIHDNDLSSLVPKQLFSETHLADYLKFNTKILKSDFITSDEISENNSINVYVPYINVNNFIYDTFGTFTYKHVSSILIKNILLLEKETKTTKFYVNVSQDHFEIIIVENKKLLLYNSFNYNTKEDFIYYILFTAEQLKLNPETLNLVFIGSILKNDDLYNITYKYIRTINFGNRFDTYKYKNKPTNNYSNFTLIKSL